MANFLRLSLIAIVVCAQASMSFAFTKAKLDSKTDSNSTATASSSSSTSSSTGPTVWVAKADGSQMCKLNTGTTLDDGANELKQAHVRVVQSQKGSDQKMHAQMCGLPSGHTNVYEIQKEDLGKAMVLGYQEIKQ